VNIRALVLTSCWTALACSAGINTADDNMSSSSAGASSVGTAGKSASGAGAVGGSTSIAGSAAIGSAGASNTGGIAGSSAHTGGTSSGGMNAGGAAPGGNGGTNGAGAAGTAASDPGGAASGFTIDYSIWQLQLPTGDFVQPNGLKAYADSYFKKASDGGQLFNDPSQGASTGGSDHARTELREMKQGSGASWSGSGTNTLTVRGKAIKCTSCTIGQIFHGDIATLAELQYSSDGGGTMKLFYEEQKGQGEAPKDVGVKVPLGQTYTFVMSLSKRVLTVTVNGHVGYTRTPSADVFSPDTFYFKAGNYDQTTTVGAVSNDVHSQIEDYSIGVVHQ